VRGYVWNLIAYRSLRKITIIALIINVMLRVAYFEAHIAMDSLIEDIYVNMVF